VGEIEVIIRDRSNRWYEQLQKYAGVHEAQNKKSFEVVLYRSIKKVIERLKQDVEFGQHISKKNVPKSFVKQLEVKRNNVWKVNLAHGWRLIYTITVAQNNITVSILKICDHKEYEKVFRYT